MIFSLQPTLDQLLKAIKRDFGLTVRKEEWRLLSRCIHRTPNLVFIVLAVSICLMKYWPVFTRLRTFSALSDEDQQKFLLRYRFSKIFGVSQTIHFLQTHTILAAHDGAADV